MAGVAAAILARSAAGTLRKRKAVPPHLDECGYPESKRLYPESRRTSLPMGYLQLGMLAMPGRSGHAPRNQACLTQRGDPELWRVLVELRLA